MISTHEKFIDGEAAIDAQHPAGPVSVAKVRDSIAVPRFVALGKTLYGLLFIVVLPTLLIVWARNTETSVPLTAKASPIVGPAMMICGAASMISGMIGLIAYGKGMPMNAYPPVRYVTRGIYRLISHPIYTGFSLLCIGFALTKNSPSGLWLVSPVVILCCLALVQGFEKHDLYKRFGSRVKKPMICLPEDELNPPSLAERLSVYLLVLLPWLALYQAVRLIGVPRDAVVAFFAFENGWPVYEWTELIYGSTYVFVLLAPLAAKTKRDLRAFSISGLAATGLIVLLYLTIPLIAPPRPFEPQGFLGKLLVWERALDTPAAAFPSFHVVWALLAARVFLAGRGRWKLVSWGWATLISISCITTGMHAIIDVIAALLVFLFVTRLRTVWEKSRRLTERLANSWREWRIGPVRIIIHGLYGAAAAFVSLSIVGTLAGPDQIIPMIIIALSILITSAIWAQVVEGSPNLLRPYGWYGGVLGALLGILIVKLFGANAWLLAGAWSVAGPVAQSIGRLRCLVQGCCHGREAPATVGIRYSHPSSRVCKLSSLAGVPVHPTPLYSILSNVFIAIVMWRLWQLHAALSLIVGSYLILTGLSRFVEESYRGEPQTAVKAGLKIYQWIAILSILAGVFVTMLESPAAPSVQPNWASVVGAGCFGLFAWFAVGVDFPDSNRRFARLA